MKPVAARRWLQVWRVVGVVAAVFGVQVFFDAATRPWSYFGRARFGGPDTGGMTIGVVIVVASVMLAVWAHRTLNAQKPSDP